jgi:hypothetical protein
MPLSRNARYSVSAAVLRSIQLGSLKAHGSGASAPSKIPVVLHYFVGNRHPIERYLQVGLWDGGVCGRDVAIKALVPEPRIVKRATTATPCTAQSSTRRRCMRPCSSLSGRFRKLGWPRNTDHKKTFGTTMAPKVISTRNQDRSVAATYHCETTQSRNQKQTSRRKRNRRRECLDVHSDRVARTTSRTADDKGKRITI